MLVSASILNKKKNARELVKNVNKTDANYLHLDIMDGKFVKNKTWTYSEIVKLLKDNTKKLDVHLMVEKPEKYIEDYAFLNTEYIIFHLEAVSDVNQYINLIKNYGVKVGIAIKPNTSINKVLSYLKDIDLVLIMSVNPGKEGQTFIEKTYNRIEKIREYINNNNLKTILEVDGGVNDANIEKLKELKVDSVVSATYIHDDNMQEKINTLR